MEMICAWKELLSVLPVWMRKDVELQRTDALQELDDTQEKEANDYIVKRFVKNG
jgi:hypothetical protein